MENNINNNDQPWTLPYMLACTVKSRLNPTSTTNDQERERKRKMLVLALAGLSSYL